MPSPSDHHRAVESLMRARAEAFAAQTHLLVDYYRIRRKIAYPLPLRDVSLPTFQVHPRWHTRQEAYPWATWLTWDLEQRVIALGTAGTWFDDDACRELASRDLAALAAWPRYDQYDQPDLSYAHAIRVMLCALRSWTWIDDALRDALMQTCARVVEQMRPWFVQRREPLVHNIVVIGSLMYAAAARIADEPDASQIAERTTHMIRDLLDLRRDGHSEGVAYDGYVYDFVLDWLAGEDDTTLLDHDQWNSIIIQSLALGAPGNVAQVAPIGDVEPVHMPFHLSMLAKLQQRRPRAAVAAYLNDVPPAWMRNDGLAAMRDCVTDDAKQPAAGAIDAHYASVLRTGWEPDDVAVVMSAARSDMGHLHHDAGSLVIGAQGKWLIDDPGYQQYIPSSERQFTIGRTAHNAPIINGQPQVARRGKLLQLSDGYMAVDMTRCYNPSLQLDSAARHVWLIGRETIIVADRVQGGHAQQMQYHWHGHPDAAWFADGDWATVVLPTRTLHIACPGTRIEQSNIHRLKGSRGQMTLVTRAASLCCWWVFAFDRQPNAKCDGDALIVDDRRLVIGKP